MNCRIDGEYIPADKVDMWCVKKALHELIDFCEPIIQKYYNEIYIYLVEVEVYDNDKNFLLGLFGSDYNSDYDIDDFIGYDKSDRELIFYCSSRDIRVCMPIDWLDSGSFDRNMDKIRETILKSRIEFNKGKIKEHKSKILLYKEDTEKMKEKLDELQLRRNPNNK